MLAGCSPGEVIKLHYLNGFVPGTRAIFNHTNLAVAPIEGDPRGGLREVGSVFDAKGKREKLLQVSDAEVTIHNALMAALADAGLRPIALPQDFDAHDLPPGVDAILTCKLLELSVEKNFGVQETIHGQYFTMNSRVKLQYTVRRRDGAILYQGDVLGVEDEPPKPVGGEVFFPLETEPAESLSVALSRAIGELIADPKFAAAFPPRAQ